MLFMLALVAVCCSEEDLVTPANPAKSGDEVQFGLSLENLSRTIYGNDTSVTTNNVTTNYFPIYWVNGDKVQIFSPQCLEGRRNAEYQVSVTGTEQNFADNLTKTGEIGVQWGNGETADFYSLYPSGNYTLSSDGTKAENIFINYSQSIIVDGATVKSDMEDCLMYAKKTSVPRGDVVNLQYDPISTVFMVTLNVPEGSADDFIIQSVSLEAPDGVDIAGTFSLNISDGSFGAWGDSKAKSVSAQIYDKATGGYYTLAKGKSVQIPLFIAPIMDQDNPEVLTIEGWKIKVVANQKEYVKTLATQTIVPGKVHKVTLPNLSTTAVVEWDVATWMKYIPRNVYLSEVSIPGTWNSLNVDCQSETTISEQYALGVRAFHLDTRWKSDNTPYLGSSTFTGISKPNITTLSVATGGSGNTYKYDDANVMRPSASSFADYLGQITTEVKNDEYMIVFCTFAQNSYNGDRCPSTWYKAISDACADNDKVYDASGLTANTLVGDVLGSVIVVVNLDATVGSSTTTLPESSKCLFTYVPMNLPSDHYSETKATAAGHVDALYYSTKASAGISMYTSHAQISTTGTSAVDCGDRGYSHPLANRDALVNSIWDWSKSNYGTPNYAHDKWIYLGLGGYIMTSSGSSGSGYDTVENRYAPMVYDRIEAMGQNNVPYYPVGIILMNNKMGSNYTNSSGTNLGYGFSDVCKEILLLNNKYRLQYDPTKPADYDPNKKNEGDYDGTGGEGGDIEL